MAQENGEPRDRSQTAAMRPSATSEVPTAGQVADQDIANPPVDGAAPGAADDGVADDGVADDGVADDADADDAEHGTPTAAGPRPGGTERTEAMSRPDEPRKPRQPRKRAGAKQVVHQTGVVANVVRSKIASVVWLVALAGAVVLALGAVLVALDANQANGIVSFVDDLAHRIDGPFADIFTFDGKNALKKEILVNWGIGAVAYLVVGRILDRIIRP